jgi:hypothetical protein
LKFSVKEGNQQAIDKDIEELRNINECESRYGLLRKFSQESTLFFQPWQALYLIWLLQMVNLPEYGKTNIQLPMKNKGIIVAVCMGVIISNALFGQTGSTCSNPYVLPVNGSCNTYTISSSTGTTTTCTTNVIYSGTGRYTYFSFTTNASGHCVLINISTSGSQPAEVRLYTANNCNNGSNQATSAMCFNTGNGLWAPAETLNLSANTTYYLRVWTPGGGTITMCAQSYNPPNNTCAGATPIGPTPITDNNACAKPGTGIAPWMLCAGSLENTVFYTYTVATTGTSAINITNIACNNGDNDNNNGMQVGFFTGSCASLVWKSCTTTSGANVTANTSSLPAGTVVTVAIDGFAGSNCQFDISATNSVALAASVKYFTAWKTSTSNILRWLTLQEFDNLKFEVQRSDDGVNFVTIGTISGELSSYSEKNYQWEDRTPPVSCYYRLKQVDINGREKYHKIIHVIRTDVPYFDIRFPNPVPNNLLLELQTNFIGEATMRIISMNGTPVLQEKIRFTKGDNNYYRNLSSLPSGKYVLVLENELTKISKTLIKTEFTPFKF